MIGCALLIGLLFGQGALAPVGTAMHYERAGAMARVAAVRGMPVAWSAIDGMASLPACRYVNARRPYFVRARLWERGRWGRWRTLQVVDCSNPRDLPRHRRTGIAPYGLEVDYRTAQQGGWAWNGRSGAGRTRAQVGWIWQP